jgi:hypothetical protein
MGSAEVEAVLWRIFNVKRGDNLPYTGTNATRKNLAVVFAECGFNRGAEIGVGEGEYSEVLCLANPNLALIGVDPWTPYPIRNAEAQKARRAKAYERLAKFPLYRFMELTSAEAATQVPDASLDFVYIDGRHDFPYIMRDIIDWAPKVRKGGIVSGHDYFPAYNQGVIPAVEAYMRGTGVLKFYVTDKDRYWPSWLWIRER